MSRSSKALVRPAPLWLALALAMVVSERASATGYFINQQSVRGLGRVNAGNVVAADDLATIFFNPAGLARLFRDSPEEERVRLSLGGHLIVPRSDQRARASLAATPGSLGVPVAVGGGDAHNPTGPSPVLNVYRAWPLRDGRAVVAIGGNFPFGLATEFEADWHGRYDATKASLLTINAGIVAAYRVNSRLAIGGGLDLQHARTSLSAAIPNPLTPGGPVAATDGSVRTTGHNLLTPGFNGGLTYDVAEGTRVGVHYRSGMSHDIEGDSEFSGLDGPLAGLNGTVGADAELRLPALASAGVRQTLSPRLVLLGEIQWFDWSAFDEVRIEFADGRPDAVRTASYRDAWGAAVGAEYAVTPRFTARGGLRHDTTPTVDRYRDTTVPDSNRLWLGLGTSVRLSERLKVDVAFNHVFFDDTAIALTRTFFDDTPLASTVNIDSDVTSVVNTIAVDFGFTF
jgi:long-chain fatty acid transport protein